MLPMIRWSAACLTFSPLTQAATSPTMRINLPNLLTILRLLAAPGVAVMFLYFNRPWADWFALGLFSAAAATDWIDGRLARAWGQETRLGAMLDPIADKAMVIIALLVITGLSSDGQIMNPWILLPSTLIIFRETFVSGLREFLGNTAGTLKVTFLAKWKTTVQMGAIAVLFSTGIFIHHFEIRVQGMDAFLIADIMEGRAPDELGLQSLAWWANATWYAGTGLLWIAAVLTLITGWDYFVKAKPHLQENS